MVFLQNTTPSALDQLIRRAKIDSNVRTFSRSFDPDMDKVDRITELFHNGTHPEIRMGALTNPDLVTQFLFVYEGKIFPFTRPCVATTSMQVTVYIGNMSDDLSGCIPIMVMASAFRGWFTSLVPNDDALKFGLPKIADVPDAINGPPTAPGAGDGEPFSMARLNFGPDAIEKNPTITALPIFLPLPAGVPFPEGDWPVGIKNEDFAEAYPFGEVWRMAHWYNFIYNEGFSVTVGGPLFNIEEFHDHISEVTVEPRGVIAIQMLDPATSAHYSPVKISSHEASNAAYIRIGNTLSFTTPVVLNNQVGTAGNPITFAYHQQNQSSVVTTPGTGSTPPQTEEDKKFEKLIDALTNNATARTPEVKEKDNNQNKVLQQFMIAFATIGQNGNDITVNPAKLRDEFKNMIKASTLNTAKKMLSEQLNAFIKATASSTDMYDRGVTISAIDLVCSVFTTAMRDFKLLDESLTATNAMEHAKTYISILAFADPIKDGKKYKDRILHDQLVTTQEAIGEEKTKMARKNTELNNWGSIITIQDIFALLCNFRIWGMMISTDFESSQVWIGCKAFLEALTSDAGKPWSRKLQDKYRHAALIMAINLQNMIKEYFVLANTLEYRRAIAAGEQIDPRAFAAASLVDSETVMELQRDMRMGKTENYKERPDISSHLSHLGLEEYKKNPAPVGPVQQYNNNNNVVAARNKPPPVDHNGGGNEPNRRGGGVAAAGQKPTAELKEQRDNEKKVGFLIWNGSGFPPNNCTVFVKMGNMKSKERVCLFYCTKGLFCGRKNNECRLGHPKSFSALPEESQREMVKYVEVTHDLEFAPGQGPKGQENRI